MRVSDHFPKTYGEFCDFTQEYALKHRKKIELRPVGYLKLDGSKCIGYCEYEGDVKLAVKHKLAPQTFVHEFCHMTQQVERYPLWETEGIDNKILPKVKSLSYLVKHGVSDWPAFYDTMLLERDCEMRSMRLIKEFELPVDIEDYAKKANLYLFFYQYIFLRRKWADSSTIYKKEILNAMPSKLVSPKKLRNIDMDIMQLYDNVLK